MIELVELRDTFLYKIIFSENGKDIRLLFFNDKENASHSLKLTKYLSLMIHRDNLDEFPHYVFHVYLDDNNEHIKMKIEGSVSLIVKADKYKLLGYKKKS